MKELDVLLERAFDRDFPQYSSDERRAFESLLGLSDPELADYLLQDAVPADPVLARLVGRIRTA